MSNLNFNIYVRWVIDTISRLPLTTATSTACIVSLTWIIRDFLQWKAFGTGGTPPTWKGYMKMTKIRINRLMSSDDLRDATPLSTEGPKYLPTTLLPRKGKRPQMMSRTMPQRQQPEPINPLARDRLQSLMQTLQSQYPDLLTLSPSKTEGRTTDAIYAKPDVPTINPLASDKILDHEIAHAHPADNSLHVWLADPDARTVIQAGWGERFPITFVKSGWTMVYAPRDNAEVDLVETIVKAGIGWITGAAV